MCNSQHTNLRCRTLLKLPLGLIGISDVGVVKRRFPYWIQKEFQRTEWLKYSLGKSGRFRTSGSTFWSRSTRSRFGHFVIHPVASTEHQKTLKFNAFSTHSSNFIKQPSYHKWTIERDSSHFMQISITAIAW